MLASTENTSPATNARMTEEARRAQLLSFGRGHFASHAFDAMPMQAIAARAGVSKGLLYHYFRGRRGFYLATITDVIEGLLEAMSAGEAREPERPLHGLITGFVEYVSDNAAIYQALVRGGLGADPEIQAQLNRVKDYAIDRIVEQLSPRQVATVAVPRAPSHDGAFLWNATARPAVPGVTRSSGRPAELSSLAHIRLAGWIAWVESATSAWLSTHDIAAAAFVDVVVETIATALPNLLR